MWPVAVFLMGVVLFYWLAFMGTIWFWANGVFSLCKGHFIRASIWFSLGGGMLLWWQGTEVIPHPWDFDAWLRGSACFVGLGVILTLLRCFHKFNRERRAGVETRTAGRDTNAKDQRRGQSPAEDDQARGE